MHGDIPAGKVWDYDDSKWYDIGLPHSFGIPYFMENEFYVGYGCYRKKLFIEESWLENQWHVLSNDSRGWHRLPPFRDNCQK